MSFLTSRLGFIFSLLTMVLVSLLFFTQVDLEPKISPNFFFSSESPIFIQDLKIRQKFTGNQQQVFIGVPSKNHFSEEYLTLVSELSQKFKTLEGVDEVFSITKGPSSPEDAFSNPLWKRMLIGKSSESTFIVLALSKENQSSTIKKIEDIIAKYHPQKFFIAGIPYSVEQMKRNIKSNMKTYTTIAVVLCTATILVIFKSIVISIFAFIASITAATLTLVILSFFGKGIGLLTSNLLIISYILTQSHIIFLLSNSLHEDKGASKAILKTFPASFWCMLTTLLGFCGLIFVDANPLQELGLGGIISTISSIFCAYFIFSPFLVLLKSRKTLKINVQVKNKNFISIVSLITITTSFLYLSYIGLQKVNTDPSLLDYFDNGSSIHNQITYMDKNGGSNPLKLVIKKSDNVKLNDHDSYLKMWKLHNELKSNPYVGSVISLPVLMAEANENWLASMLTWKTIIKVLNSEYFNSVIRNFLSKDQNEALYILRMKENVDGDVQRLTVINQLKKIVRSNSFDIVNIGGPYYLQGELAKSVKSSLLTGVLSLIGIFSLIIFFITKSVSLLFILPLSISAIVGIIFGAMGILGIPIDIISSPGITIALGVAVDTIIHICRSAVTNNGGLNWNRAIKEQGSAATISILCILIGFSVFLFSDFPPTRRFGGIIIAGVALAFPIAIAIIPYTEEILYQLNLKKITKVPA